MLPGWAESEGVRIEVKAAEAHGSRISYLEAPDRFAGLTPTHSAELRRKLLD